MIFLESPGSLVELGIFCTKPNFYKKLVIVAPQKEVEEEDSFIFLGPLQNIQKKDSTSVVVYPWPDPKIFEYDESNLVDLLNHINDKLNFISSKNKSGKFDSDISSHIALLICEIIRLCYPILIGEIEIALEAMDISITTKDISRHLYLLSKFQLINKHTYSGGYNYYFPIKTDDKKIKFSNKTEGQVVESKKIRMGVVQSFISSEDHLSQKITTAQRQIMEKLRGGA